MNETTQVETSKLSLFAGVCMNSNPMRPASRKTAPPTTLMKWSTLRPMIAIGSAPISNSS